MSIARVETHGAHGMERGEGNTRGPPKKRTEGPEKKKKLTETRPVAEAAVTARLDCRRAFLNMMDKERERERERGMSVKKQGCGWEEEEEEKKWKRERERERENAERERDKRELWIAGREELVWASFAERQPGNSEAGGICLPGSVCVLRVCMYACIYLDCDSLFYILYSILSIIDTLSLSLFYSSAGCWLCLLLFVGIFILGSAETG